MSTIRNPLAYYIVEAQDIVIKARMPGGDPTLAIDRLAKLLCTPQANDELNKAGAFTGVQIIFADAKQATAGGGK